MAAETPSLDTIFCAALELASADERAAYIARTCGDDRELQARVEKLVDAHFRAGSFLNQPAPAPGDTGPFISPSLESSALKERPGTVIGPYKLLQQIGEGGMGTVFMAEQTQPVKRKVALKLIKPGMDSRQVIARFEAERQALAMMDHVNIARVFDAGTTDSGRPYFVMELVHGVPITKYCDDNQLTPRERLELFVPVCQAIQHAHQKGVIHRDIKPSNVMVTLYDGKPVPKVIDFGVAKATDQKLTERTLFTQYGTMVGTLEYMSPEQAEMSALGVDTRSDVYSLGALLYELLTGSTPLIRKRFKDAAYAEILRIIKEEEPPKPSTRLSDSGAALASISAQRKTEPAKLSKLMRGELDWIVMKTLEKDRNRRYETANGFAADVQRYLNDEVVQARPPSPGYRLQKFVRRNRVVITTAALLAVALVVGATASIWQAFRATRAQQQAQANFEAAEGQRQRAERHFREAREAVDTMLTRVGDERLAKVPQMEQVRRELLEEALQFYQRFLQEEGDDPEVRMETGTAYQRVADINRSLERPGEVEKAYRHAQVIFDRLAADFPGVPGYRFAQAHLYHNLAEYIKTTGIGRQAESEQVYRQGLAIIENLLRQNPDDPEYRNEFPRIAIELSELLCRSQTTFDEGQRLLHRGLEMLEKLVKEFPDEPKYKLYLAGAHMGIGIFCLNNNNLTDGETQFRRAVSLLDEVATRLGTRVAPAELTLAQKWLPACLNGLGNVFLQTDRPQEAEPILRRAVEVSRRQADDFPTVPGYRTALAESLITYSGVLEKLNRNEEALAACNQAQQVCEKATTEWAGQPYAWYLLALAQSRTGRLLRLSGQPQEAVKAHRKALGLCLKFFSDFPDDTGLAPSARKLTRVIAVRLDALAPQSGGERNWGRHIGRSSTCIRNLSLIPLSDHAYTIWICHGAGCSWVSFSLRAINRTRRARSSSRPSARRRSRSTSCPRARGICSVSGISTGASPSPY